MEWNNFIDDSEEFKAKFEYISFTRKVKVLAATNKRAFIFKKSHNDYKFVSSHKTISQIEYGLWRMPYWLWFYLIASFIYSIYDVTTNVNPLDIGVFISLFGTLIFCIIYRKFEYINTAVGCEPFRVLSRRQSVVTKIEKFINILHSTPTNLRHTREEFVVSNYFDKLIKRLVSVILFMISPIPIVYDIIMAI